MFTRRATLAGGLALAACSHRGDPDQAARTQAMLRRIEQRLGEGGRLGLAAYDTGSGARISYRADERFAMASTFKWLLAAAALERLPHDRVLNFSQSDLIDWSPSTSERVGEGGLSVNELCEAAVTVSDNTAANLLLNELGGPGDFTNWLHNNVDVLTRIDRMEPALNENAEGDIRDTTTPASQIRAMRRLLVGNELRRSNRERLRAWMVASRTGLERLRAGLPDEWRVGDKTGTGANGAVNDVAIAWPTKKLPILIACYLDRGTADAATRNAVHAEVARLVVDWL